MGDWEDSVVQGLKFKSTHAPDYAYLCWGTPGYDTVGVFAQSKSGPGQSGCHIKNITINSGCVFEGLHMGIAFNGAHDSTIDGNYFYARGRTNGVVGIHLDAVSTEDPPVFTSNSSFHNNSCLIDGDAPDRQPPNYAIAASGIGGGAPFSDGLSFTSNDFNGTGNYTAISLQWVAIWNYPNPFAGNTFQGWNVKVEPLNYNTPPYTGAWVISQIEGTNYWD